MCNLQQLKNRFFHVPQPTCLFPLEMPLRLSSNNVAWMERQFNASQIPSRMYISVFNSFRVIRCLSQCISPKIVIFYHIFVSPGDAPGAITLNIVWMKREFYAYKLSRSMYLSIFNSFRVIRCLSQCVSPKIAIFTTFLFPWGNHAKCYMDGKRIRCLQIASLNVPI